MAAGRWLFGIGGPLTYWYLPTIGLGYLLIHVWVARRVTRTRRLGRRTKRGTIVSLILSWVNAVAFGITVPDLHEGELTTIISHSLGDLSRELAIALCNPLAIIAFVCAGFAVGFAISDSREAKPEEDEYDGPNQMVPHPFA